MNAPTGKIAVVTGSDSGMGRAMAEEFARAGADLALTYHSDEGGAQESCHKVESAGRRAIVRQLDVREEASVEALFEAVSRELGAPAILVNDAGVGGGGRAVTETTLEEFDRVRLLV